MLESVRCPSCLTHYGLRPERVHPGLRKARCFRCKEVFRIEEAVARLLAQAPQVNLVEQETQTAYAFPTDLPPETRPPTPHEADAEAALLTLGDLEGLEEETLEKTLVVEPHPEEPRAPEPEADLGGGGFASAKDAISKLLGDLPEPTPAVERRTLARPTQPMDVEATLDALESTLGGVTPASLNPTPSPAAPSGATTKLSAAEIQAAMAAADVPPAPPLHPPTPPPQPQPTEPPAAPEPTLLKLKVGSAVYPNITLEQAEAWIEQGRLQEWHLVARQHSDNWIEASKVPSLRIVFDRVRRQHGGAPDLPSASTSETESPKKGLFGWIKR